MTNVFLIFTFLDKIQEKTDGIKLYSNYVCCSSLTEFYFYISVI